MAGNAQSTGYEPNLVKDSQTCIEVSREHTPISTATRRDIFHIERDERFAIPEDADIFTPRAASSQRSAASTVPALMNLDFMSVGKNHCRV